ncbi:MAG: amino acid ABC transporter substrate-binding protein [Alphaproteobacteria bacterium]|nr:amino acid ABC transporter substrate-binding protein [Alphaproteobacteria bacterium]
MLALIGWCAGLGGAPERASAGVIEEVERSGVLVAGTRAESPPFGFIGPEGQPIGFSVDMLREIAAGLSQLLNRPVQLELKPVTPETRMEMIHTGAIQIECGITTATWARQQKADFSIPFFANGTRILTHRSLGQSIDDLGGKRIGVVADSTTRPAVENAVPKAAIVEFPDMAQGMRLFAAGQIDAVSNISVVLRGLLEQSQEKGGLVLLPRDGAIQYEPIACMLPRNDSEWRGFVDRVIARDLKGAPDYEGRYVEIYNQWFGPGATMPLPLDREVIQLLVHAAYWLD